MKEEVEIHPLDSLNETLKENATTELLLNVAMLSADVGILTYLIYVIFAGILTGLGYALFIPITICFSILAFVNVKAIVKHFSK